MKNKIFVLGFLVFVFTDCSTLITDLHYKTYEDPYTKEIKKPFINTTWILNPPILSNWTTVTFKNNSHLVGSFPVNYPGTWSLSLLRDEYHVRLELNGKLKEEFSVQFEGRYFPEYQRIVGYYTFYGKTGHNKPRLMQLVPTSPINNSTKGNLQGLAELLNAEFMEDDISYNFRLDTYSKAYGSTFFVYEFIKEFAKEKDILVFYDKKVKSPYYKNKMDLGWDFLEYEEFDTYDVYLLIGKTNERGMVLFNYDAEKSMYSGEIYDIRYINK